MSPTSTALMRSAMLTTGTKAVQALSSMPGSIVTAAGTPRTM